jgi:hypothetical protein
MVCRILFGDTLMLSVAFLGWHIFIFSNFSAGFSGNSIVIRVDRPLLLGGHSSMLAYQEHLLWHERRSSPRFLFLCRLDG